MKLLSDLGIRYKLLIPSFALWILFLIGLHYLWLPGYLSNKKQDYLTSQYHLLSVLGSALNDPILQKNHKQVSILLEQTAQDHPTWKSITVKNESGKQLISLTPKPVAVHKSHGDGEIKIQHGIVHAGSLVGILEVIVDLEPVLKKELAQIHSFDFLIFVVLGISALVSVFVQDKWIKAPLQSLAIAAKQLSHGDMSVKLPDGSKDEIGELVFAFRTMSNSLQLTHLALQDEVSRALETAAQLSESERRFRTVFNSIADTLVIIDENGKIRSVNPAATKMLGYREEELASLPISVLFHGPGKEAHNKWLAALLSGRMAGAVGEVPRQVDILCKDARQIHVDVSVNVLPIGDARHFIAMVRDISVYKQLQDRLQAEKEQAQNYLNTASVIMIAMDTAGLITLVNEKGCQVLGYTVGQLIGKNWFQLLFADDVAKELAAEYQRVVQGEAYFPQYFEGSAKTHSREQKIIVWHTSILKDTKTGDIKGLLVSGEDITEFRKSEQTRKVLHKQLLQAQKMEAVGQLTGGIAHDFNNILASIMGYSELAMLKAEQSNDEKLKHYVGQIYTSGERARDLVGKMLAFSRGKASETPAPLYLNAVISELVPLLRSVIPSTVKIETELDANLPAVSADTVDVQQIVMNLCINARDAMEDKGRIAIRTMLVTDINSVCASCHKPVLGDYVQISINDTGPGISKEHFQKLFEPFFSTKEIGKGSGLGLSVVHGVVHARYGHIIVDSTAGLGSRFRILFKSSQQRMESDVESLAINSKIIPNTANISELHSPETKRQVTRYRLAGGSAD